MKKWEMDLEFERMFDAIERMHADNARNKKEVRRLVKRLGYEKLIEIAEECKKEHEENK